MGECGQWSGEREELAGQRGQPETTGSFTVHKESPKIDELERGIRVILLGLINSISSQAMAWPEFPEITRSDREEREPGAYQGHEKSTASPLAHATIVRPESA